MPSAPRESFRARRLRVLNETDEERAARIAALRAPKKPPRRRLPRAARKVVHVGGATHDWRSEQSSRADLALRNQVRALIETTCSAATFDWRPAWTLATRDLFPVACDVLTATIQWPAGQREAPHVLMWQSQNDSLLAFRLANAFCLFEVTSWGSAAEKITREWLRERPECETSRTVLALMGECSWPNAGRRERAALLLHHVVEARRQ